MYLLHGATPDARATLASSFSCSCSDGHHFACVDHYCCSVCGHCLAYVCCARATCSTCGCVGVRVCAFVHWTPHFGFLIIFALLAAAAAVRIMSATPSLKLKLFTLWQPRYNSSRTSSSPFCDGHGRFISRACVCVLCSCMRVRATFALATNA